jgi:hypothetical protein
MAVRVKLFIGSPLCVGTHGRHSANKHVDTFYLPIHFVADASLKGDGHVVVHVRALIP